MAAIGTAEAGKAVRGDPASQQAAKFVLDEARVAVAAGPRRPRGLEKECLEVDAHALVMGCALGR